VACGRRRLVMCAAISSTIRDLLAVYGMDVMMIRRRRFSTAVTY
jgi:hypothetical protein